MSRLKLLRRPRPCSRKSGRSGISTVEPSRKTTPGHGSIGRLHLQHRRLRRHPHAERLTHARRAPLVSVLLAIIYTSMIPANAETLTCTDWQGIRTCSSPGGYTSHELQWQGMTIGDDNQGRRWSTSRWQGFTTTTVTPPPDRR